MMESFDFVLFDVFIQCMHSANNIIILERLRCEVTYRIPTEGPQDPSALSTSLGAFSGLLWPAMAWEDYHYSSLYLKRSAQPLHGSSRTQAFINEDRTVRRGTECVGAK